MKKILSVALCALFIGGVSSCKDYEDEIRNDVNQAISAVKTQFGTEIKQLQGSITALEGQLKTMKEQCDADHGRIDALEDELEAMKEQLKTMATKQDVDSVRTDLENFKGEIRKELAVVDSIAKANGLEIEKINEELIKTNSALQDAVAQLNALKNSINSQITSIQVQSIVTPVLGDVSINVGGIQSTLLCSYFGENIKGTKDFYGYSLYKNPKLLSNAGKIYFTLNPVGNDFTGAHVKLVKSNGNLAPVQLTAFVPATTYEVRVGISRDPYLTSTRADQEFLYESTAYYPTVAAAAENAIEYEQELKALAKDAKALIKEKKASGVKKFIEDLFYTVIKNSDARAYMVAADYDNADGEHRSVVGPCNIAVKAIKPISFGLDAAAALGHPNLHGSFPGVIETLEKIKGELNLDGVINNITIGSLDFSGSTITGNVLIDGNPHTLSFDSSILNSGNFANVLAQEIAKLLNTDNTGVIAQIEKCLTDKMTVKINALEGNKYVHAADKIVNFLNSTIEKIATRVDDINYYLQPIMVFGNKEMGYHHLSTTPGAPTYVSGAEINLYATTYTNDIINPAFKKAVVIKNLTTGQRVATFNAFDGSIRGIDYKFPASGKYEIVYAAVDYTGYVVETSYYVNVAL